MIITVHSVDRSAVWIWNTCSAIVDDLYSVVGISQRSRRFFHLVLLYYRPSVFSLPSRSVLLFFLQLDGHLEPLSGIHIFSSGLLRGFYVF